MQIPTANTTLPSSDRSLRVQFYLILTLVRTDELYKWYSGQAIRRVLQHEWAAEAPFHFQVAANTF